jgi:hypothetical protein
MILVLRAGTSAAELAEVLALLERHGMRGQALQANERTLVHIVSGSTRRARRLRKLEQVEALVPTSGPRVRAQGRRFYPYHFVNWSAVVVLLLGLLVLLAGQYPPGIGAEIDAEHPPQEVTEPWFWRAPLAFVASFPAALAWLGWLLLLLLAALIFCLPLLHRSRGGSRHAREKSGA